MTVQSVFVSAVYWQPILFLLLWCVPCLVMWWSTGSCYPFPSYINTARSPHFWLSSIQPSMYVYICHQHISTSKLKVKLLVLVNEFVSFQNKTLFSILFLPDFFCMEWQITVITLLYQYNTGRVQYYCLLTRLVFLCSLQPMMTFVLEAAHLHFQTTILDKSWQ